MPAYIIHYGNPVHHGGPSIALGQMIRDLTRVDEHGQSYWRKATHEPWRRLRYPDDFARLNRAIDEWRRKCADVYAG